MTTDKRIFVVSLSQGEPMSMLAGYRDGQLHIVECNRLPRRMAELKTTLPEKMESLRKKGFIVLVDEVMPVFGKYGRSVKLSDNGADGRPVLVSALETYKNMSALQAITLPALGAGTFDISDSIVEQQRDGKGNVSYHIDWSELRAESVLLLLAINAATQDSMLDECTATNLLKTLGAKQREPSITNPFAAITKGFDARFLSPDSLERKQ